ncbi:PREDICTED: uncharacterized protein LOC105144685 isoform X1 [Acromyrmex echinatior]|uniref:uncharacterized protein LOC105144685 isoform X1 n=1 Tax=Acromyrmex echinatior TaxID=103372 RepID=UPI000580F6FC|nr:PREDICTED: uncharacterized protein LOC105144685 isoform X1 [Acromyrmex echinatior]
MALPGRAPRFVAFVFASWRPILVYSIYVHISLTGNPDRPALISSMPRLDARITARHSATMKKFSANYYVNQPFLPRVTFHTVTDVSHSQLAVTLTAILTVFAAWNFV